MGEWGLNMREPLKLFRVSLGSDTVLVLYGDDTDSARAVTCQLPDGFDPFNWEGCVTTDGAWVQKSNEMWFSAFADHGGTPPLSVLMAELTSSFSIWAQSAMLDDSIVVATGEWVVHHLSRDGLLNSRPLPAPADYGLIHSNAAPAVIAVYPDGRAVVAAVSGFTYSPRRLAVTVPFLPDEDGIIPIAAPSQGQFITNADPFGNTAGAVLAGGMPPDGFLVIRPPSSRGAGTHARRWVAGNSTYDTYVRGLTSSTLTMDYQSTGQEVVPAAVLNVGAALLGGAPDRITLNNTNGYGLVIPPVVPPAPAFWTQIKRASVVS